MPLNEIDAVLFNFSTSSMESAIYLSKREEKVLFQKIKRGTIKLKDLFSSMSLMLKANKINLGSLKIAYRIYLENILQEEIKKRSGISGL